MFDRVRNSSGYKERDAKGCDNDHAHDDRDKIPDLVYFVEHRLFVNNGIEFPAADCRSIMNNIVFRVILPYLIFQIQTYSPADRTEQDFIILIYNHLFCFGTGVQTLI
ncbi:hypothetical protein D3C75_990320 [compost metagenome]